MNISDEAVEAAVPWINDFMERRGFALRGKEAEALAAYVLAAAAPHLMAAALDEAASSFQERLSDGTGNGRAYNSYRVAAMLRDRASAYRSAGAGDE